MTSKTEGKQRYERLRHALWAALIAIVASILSLPQPIDELTWIVQANLANFEASGDIVYVNVDRDPTDPEFPQRREELARAIDKLREAGAHSVYLDMTFDRASRPESDRALNLALRGFGQNAYLISNTRSGITDEEIMLDKTTELVGREINQLGGHREFGLFGIVWSMPYVVADGQNILPGASLALSGQDDPGAASFPINYGFDIASIPNLSIETLASLSGNSLHSFALGKRILIGHRRTFSQFTIPGHRGVPGGIIHIYAAETLKSGFTNTIPPYTVSLLLVSLFIFASIVQRERLRAFIYTAIALQLLILFISTTYIAVRPSLGGSITLLIIYSAFRLRSKWKMQVLLIDEQTGLPTFAALEADREIARQQPTIIVAKLHRFEEVRLTLAPALQAEYILRVNQRLTAASPDAKIYIGPGHAIAWCVAENDVQSVKDHLEGLRALFGSSLQVGDQRVDVGITFGVDISPTPDTARRLASAVAAAERTTETYLPILVAEARTEEELIWNISLQARIDAALEKDEIFLLYQPKIRIDSGEMVGMEALVRWRDPERGIIPPDGFIRQCEESGRMGHLTRHVLREACRAHVGLMSQRIELSIAVNLSATLLHDPGLVAMIRQVITETGADARWITLEITETYRLADMDAARMNLLELSTMGMTISMDDFGVGAASLEALLHLPFDELKIDRVFIDRIGDDAKALAIVQSTVDMGGKMGIIVVAEGVENANVLDMLRLAGCPLAQGFGICRPVPLEEAVRFRHKLGKLKTA